jgi:serine/threonine protein kinase
MAAGQLKGLGGVPDRIGPYTLGEQLDAGGSGSVFRASKAVMTYALKLMVCISTLSKERFDRETRLVSNLQHEVIT